jgi:hypothetical protein
MVQWTTPFMIGITYGSLNSDNVLFHPYQVFTSSFPNQPNILGKQKMGAWTSAFTIGISNLSRTALPTVKSTLFQSTLL